MWVRRAKGFGTKAVESTALRIHGGIVNTDIHIDSSLKLFGHSTAHRHLAKHQELFTLRSYMTYIQSLTQNVDREYA